jgi:hypothetical protein
MRSPSEPLGSFDRRDRAPGIECGAGWPAIPVQLLDRLETAAAAGAAGCSGPVAEDAEALTAADAAMAVHRLLTYDPKALAGRTGTTGTPSCEILVRGEAVTRRWLRDGSCSGARPES